MTFQNFRVLTVALITISGIGCGPDLSHHKEDYWIINGLYFAIPNIKGITFEEARGTVTYPGHIDRLRMQKGVDLAEKLINRRYGELAFTKLVPGLFVQMEAGSFPCVAYEEGCGGEFRTIEGRVRIQVSGYSFVHELIHAQEAKLVIPGTGWHEGWKTNGQVALSDEFERLNESWWIWD